MIWLLFGAFFCGFGLLIPMFIVASVMRTFGWGSFKKGGQHGPPL